MKIIADNNIPYLKGVFEPYCDITYLAGEDITNDILKDAEILIVRTRTICNHSLLKGTNVKFIASATIGVDHIDEEYCRNQNIEYINAPGCNAAAVQQWFITALLYFCDRYNIDITKRTLGVIGVGNVGKKIVEFAEIMGLGVLLNDPPREKLEGRCGFRSLDTLISECDIITLHVPLSYSGENSTYHLVDNDFLGRVKTNSILINSSRGEVVDTQALRRCFVNEGRGRAILDVWENEPNVAEEMINATAIATPHIAGYSVQGKINGTIAVVKAVGKYLGLPMDDWGPGDELNIQRKKISINCAGKSLQDIVWEAFNKTYKIEEDDKLLRNNPMGFEKFRTKYNYRYEPVLWDVRLLNGNEAILKALELLGFTVLSAKG